MTPPYEKTPPKPPPLPPWPPNARAVPLLKTRKRRPARPDRSAVASDERTAAALPLTKRLAAAAETGKSFFLPDTSVKSFLISLSVHVVGLLGLAVVFVSHDVETPPRQLEFNQSATDVGDLELQDLPALEVAVLDDWEEMSDWEAPEELLLETPVAAISIESDLLVNAPAQVNIEAFLENGGMQVGGLLEAVGNAHTGARRGRGQGRGHGEGFGGELGRRLAREGGQSGSIQISLLWNNRNDLDLHVVTPEGERIFYGNRQSRSLGRLDVDMNAGGKVSNQPVENIFWPQGSPALGKFVVYVDYFARHDMNVDETAYEVHLLVDGEKQVFRGVLQDGANPFLVTTFVRKPLASHIEPSFIE